MLKMNNVPGHMGRRQILFGLAAVSLAGCSDGAAMQPVVLGDTDPDPLWQIRLPADAPVDIWARHLHLPSLRNSPQMLALSGGAEDGAFGAGALCGLSTVNRRPTFDLVTGVSTGALMAPFAFLGSEYDDTLRSIFTEHDAKDIMRFRGVNAVRSDALYDTTPLADLIKHYTPSALLDAIADRHQAGGRLFMVTSNLEAARAQVWNMGAVAKRKDYGLFRAIMRASGALPGLFSPVMLRYQANGKDYREAHVDGGVHMQFLATPKAAFNAPRRHSGGGHVYLLINNTLAPAPQIVSHTPLGISQHALTTMVRSNAALSVNVARILAKEHGLEFSVACVNPDVGVEYDPSDRFSGEYMNALFQHGYTRAISGRLWEG